MSVAKFDTAHEDVGAGRASLGRLVFWLASIAFVAIAATQIWTVPAGVWLIKLRMVGGGGGGGGGGAGYAYWSSGVLYDLAPVVLLGSYVAASPEAKSLFYGTEARHHWLATLIWRF